MSNWLPILAARINEEHTAVAGAIKRGLQHAMAAGDLLLEAKSSLPHGEWLPWLLTNCTISDRTARLYMRLARNRPVIEGETAMVADITVRGAAALVAIKEPEFRDLIEDVETTVEDIQRAEKVSRDWVARFGELSEAYELAPMWQAAYADLAAALNGLERAVEIADNAEKLKLATMWADIAGAAAGQIRDQSRRAMRILDAFVGVEAGR